MKTALVVGGTGPTGPHIVEGLAQRGYEIVIMHTGRHEIDFAVPTEHIHLDPNFREGLDEAIGTRPWWDLIVFSYGRLREGIEAAKGRTGRFVAVGATNPAFDEDPRLGILGHPLNLREEHLVGAAQPDDNKISRRMTEARDAAFAAHAEGHFNMTYIGYPANVYGPRAPGPREWCIVRRLLDGRREIILPDGGVAPTPRGYGPNIANGILLAVDQPAASAGRSFNVADLRQYTLRAVVEGIARHMGRDVEIVDMPYEFAVPSRAINMFRAPVVPNTHRIEAELGYRDEVPPEIALGITVDWLLANRPEPGGSVEARIGAVFDYEKEDQLISTWRSLESQMRDTLERVDYPDKPLRHVYDHPKTPTPAPADASQPVTS